MNKKELTLRQKLFRKYWWFTTFWGRGNQYFNIPIKWIATYGIIATYIKLFFGFDNTTVLLSCGIGLILLITIVGYIDVKKHIMHEENSFNNQFSPEMMHLVKKAGGKVKK